MQDSYKLPGPMTVPPVVLNSGAPHAPHVHDDDELAHFLEALPCPALLESEGNIVATNSLARELSGLPRNSTVASEQVFLGAYPFSRGNPVLSPGERKTDNGLQDFHCVLLCRSGNPVAVQGSLKVVETPSGPRRVVLVFQRKPAVGESNGEETFLGELLDAAPEGMAITYNGHLVHVNREFSRLFGYSPDACIGREIDSLLMPADRMHETEQMYHLLASEGRVALDTVRLNSAGSPIDVSVLAGPVRLGGGSYGLFYTFRDIRPHKEMVARLQHHAQHDNLTNLANRALFQERLDVALTRLRRRPSRTFAVLFLDLDGFKEVNDTLGHSAGDDLLREISSRLKGCLRLQDTIARFGGDEFAVLLDEPESPERCRQIGQRVLSRISETVYHECGEMRVSASIGITFIDDYEMPIEDILDQADVAMYDAKRAGKARIRLYFNGMTMLKKAS